MKTFLLESSVVVNWVTRLLAKLFTCIKENKPSQDAWVCLTLDQDIGVLLKGSIPA